MHKENLFFSHKFWPIFWTQFWGALNDNIFKNALVILIAYRSISILGLSADQMVALCGGIFILPFFLFSSLAGQYSDKLSKSRLAIFTKYLELIVMILGVFGLINSSIEIMFIALFLMGVQSTIFGPVKYSILPELIHESDLIKGNAQIEMGTFLAILIGTILGGVFIGKENGERLVSIAIITVSIIGLLSSLRLPSLPAADPGLKINYNIFTSTIDVLKISRKTKSVFISILGISWFWFFGATLLSIFPVYVKEVLHSDENVVTLFLAVFSIGVAIGSIICEKCSQHRVELGLVPFGSIGLSFFVLQLYLIGKPYLAEGPLLALDAFLLKNGSKAILINLSGLSVMSGFFIVPLYTFIQVRSEREIRSRVIAANNILNALLMVAAAVLLMILFAFNLTTLEVLLTLFILNTLVSIYIYTVIPEFLWRFLCVILGRMIYRIRVEGLENIPAQGPAVLVCNHVSFVDWLIISASIQRPVRFVMHYSFMNIPVLSFFFRGAKVIPIAGAKEDVDIMEKAFDQISATLNDAEIVCIFPEGQITRDGKVCPFRPGIEKILQRNPVPVVPMVLRGLWGSFFSRKYGKGASKFSVIPSRIWSRVDLNVESSWPPNEVTALKLENKIKTLLGEAISPDLNKE